MGDRVGERIFTNVARGCVRGEDGREDEIEGMPLEYATRLGQ